MIQEKNSIQSELYNYMTRFSDLKIFKENLDMDYKNQLKSQEDKISSLNLLIQEKELQVCFKFIKLNNIIIILKL